MEDSFALGFVVANIIGNHQYEGKISRGEILNLVREPLNAYDKNAIQVFNTGGIQVGHIESIIAAVLAPLIDSDLITIEGIMPRFRGRRKYRMPCELHIFTSMETLGSVKLAISEKLELHSRPAVVKGKKGKEKLDSVDKFFKSEDENVSKKATMKPLEPPDEVIKTQLLLHQKEGLRWLLDRENSDELPPFWKQKNGEFVNVLTTYWTAKRPEPLRGGIFADDMGLGKTLTLLSLIAFDRPSKRTTLVVCPPSVLSSWTMQLEEHTYPAKLSLYTYYGDRTRQVKELQKYDIVLTSYSTLATEESWLDDSPMKKMNWWRVILDEAHLIKNDNAKQSKAVTHLNATCRWAVTGTPIQNGSLDLFSLMAFLRFEPFSTKSYWRSLVQRPLAQGNENGLSRLQVLVKSISLRRTKGSDLIGLPPKTLRIFYVELSVKERELYDQIERKAKSIVQNFIDDDDSLVRNYSTVLGILLRLRQICTSLALLPQDHRSLFDIKDVSNKPELLKKMVAMLQGGEDLNCPICISPPTDVVITCCGHIFCRPCIVKTIEQIPKPCCPLCRQPLSQSDLFSAPPESSDADNNETTESSKVSALLTLLQESRDQNPATKSVVFSQFRTMLLQLEKTLTAAGFKILRLDGSMNANQRAQVIEEFQRPGANGPTVLLASLKASGAGINLTAASRVYLLEPWWNPAVEEQAMDRVHRIGQKDDVKIVRLIARNSIEERLLELQERKKKLATEAFQRKGAKDLKGIQVSDLRTLMSL